MSLVPVGLAFVVLAGFAVFADDPAKISAPSPAMSKAESDGWRVAAFDVRELEKALEEARGRQREEFITTCKAHGIEAPDLTALLKACEINPTPQQGAPRGTVTRREPEAVKK